MRDDVARAAALRALEIAREAKAMKSEKGDKGDPGEVRVLNVPVPGDQGPMGPSGARGLMGPSGPRGAQGDRGDPGPQGPEGKQGATGPAGANGKDGAAGPKGERGLKGDKGDKGDLGPMPKHERKGLMFRFEKSAGEWGEWIIVPTGGGGGRDDKLTDLQKQLVEVGNLIRTQGDNNNKFIKTVGGVLQWDTLDGSDIDLASPPVIGNTTPNAATFTTLTANSTSQFGRGSANYFEFAGAAATQSLEAKALGSDTNIAFTIDSKGTGAINLAPGSSGVNISNGGTVTAITGTAAGTGYTSIPSVAISAPTTAGGVQATATAQMQFAGATPTVVSGGTGYTAGDVLTVVGGTGTAATITVNTVSGGVITAASYTTAGTYSALPSMPFSVSGGTGNGATFNGTFAVRTTAFTITNAGSGYVEQPTVTFSGGGGSGAAAYATVGSGTVVRSLGSTMDFYTPNAGIAMRIEDVGSGVSSGYFRVRATTGAAQLLSTSSLSISSSGANNVSILTNGLGSEQLRVSHTASAVNYVQVTGAATGGLPTISAQGSDTNVAMFVTSKGNGTIRFATNNAAQTQLRISHTTSAVNFLNVTGSIAGAAPVVSVDGNDTNIDLALTPKGTGLVRFGTRTASADAAITGYIEVRDSGGTIRRLAIIG